MKDKNTATAPTIAQITDAERVELTKLRAENTRLTALTKLTLNLKVSAKGGVSVYGLGRWPTTLYKEQMKALLDIADEIRAFMIEHYAELKNKGDSDNGNSEAQA